MIIKRERKREEEKFLLSPYSLTHAASTEWEYKQFYLCVSYNNLILFVCVIIVLSLLLLLLSFIMIYFFCLSFYILFSFSPFQALPQEFHIVVDR